VEGGIAAMSYRIIGRHVDERGSQYCGGDNLRKKNGNVSMAEK
jgi:hypothetical protein